MTSYNTLTALTRDGKRIEVVDGLVVHSDAKEIKPGTYYSEPGYLSVGIPLREIGRRYGTHVTGTERKNGMNAIEAMEEMDE